MPSASATTTRSTMTEREGGRKAQKKKGGKAVFIFNTSKLQTDSAKTNTNVEILECFKSIQSLF